MPNNPFKSKYFYLASIVFLLPIFIYLWNFHFRHNGLDFNFHKYVSSDPTNWGVFGDFVGGITNPILSIINIVVVIWLAKKVYDLETSREKENQDTEKRRQSYVNTFEMMKEWDSESLRKARYTTYENYVLDRNKKERTIHDMQSFSELSLDHKTSAIRIMEFFDRLNFLKDENLIDIDAARKYFSQDYSYWESKYFSLQREMLKNDPNYSYAFNEKKYNWLSEQSQPSNRQSP